MAAQGYIDHCEPDRATMCFEKRIFTYETYDIDKRAVNPFS